MKYIIRAVKYFFYFFILLAIMLGILVLAHVTDANNIEELFKDGYNSLVKIAIMFGCISAIYPLFGFQKKDAIVPGEYREIRTSVIEFMESRGYRLESEQEQNLTFRYRSPVNRFFRMFEDRITMTRSISGFEVEGLRKDVIRIVYGLEQKMRMPEQ
ncbi:MAG: hypothetical protein J6S66_03045 [Bacteroidales bacterium]|nr:hypothetical protein [Bacteroidales bacterium]